MAGKFARLACAVTAAAGMTLAGGLSASAAARPSVGMGEEIVLTYYNNAQHTTVIGGYSYGCVFSSWGSNSSFFTTNSYACSGN